MFPLLILPKLLGGLTSMIKSTGSLAEGAANSVSEEAEKSKTMADAVMQNVAETTSTDDKEDEKVGDKKELFGGLDLAKVKSTIEDKPAEGSTSIIGGKGIGVYREILAVNKSMAASLLRINETLKMLLSIEYERIQGMVRESTGETLDKGEGGPKEKAKKKGLFGRAAAGVGGMLGGAFSKAKGGLGGNIGTLLKLGGVVLLFKKFEKEIRAATEAILEYFYKVYKTFQSDGFMAAFDMIANDLKTVFLPKIKSVVLDFLDMMFTVIKEAIFGASGDTRIQQEAGDADISRTAISNLTDKAVAGGADLSKMKFNAAGIITGTNSGTTPLTRKENKLLKSKIDDHVKAMGKISEESDGRIQWSTFPGYKFGQYALKNIDDIFRLHSISDFINANPVIDGTEYPDWGILSNINLNEMGGIDRTMSDDRVDEITAVLRAKTNAYQEGDLEELNRLQGDYLKLNPTVIQSNKFQTPGTTVGTSGLAVTGGPRGEGSVFNYVTSSTDKSVQQSVSAPTTNQVALAARETNFVALTLGTHVNVGNVTGTVAVG